MAGTGHLERAVLQVLWDRPSPVAARDVLAALAERSGRAHLYQASVSPEAYVADLMVEALGQAPDRSAALTRASWPGRSGAAPRAVRAWPCGRTR